jgi:hypothetical protein
MKKNTLLRIVLFSLITMITACSSNTDYSNAQVNRNFLRENWIPQVNLNPAVWTRGADNWFFSGQPTPLERYANVAPSDKAMTIMAVKVPQFTEVTVDGCFQVQISGEQDRNSVFILGPNDLTRQITVQVWKNTLYIAQIKQARPANLKNVIVRIGVNNLHHLKVAGGANVEGRNLSSNGLIIHANNNGGNILLSGQMNLMRVTNWGSGCVSILGAYTPCLDINAFGNGAVNVSGRVGIRSINHQGYGAVNVIGADSNALSVNALHGSTTVAGYVNLKKLTAVNESCVLIYWVNSNGAYIIQRGNAGVGLAGSATMLDINMANNTRFMGQYLHGGSIYVQTHNTAHANIAADKRIFASAVDNSSIYFFGSPNIVSRYTADKGAVIPVWSETTTLPVPAMAPTFWTARGPTVRGYK